MKKHYSHAIYGYNALVILIIHVDFGNGIEMICYHNLSIKQFATK